MGCASQSRSWGHRCRWRNPTKTFCTFSFFLNGEFLSPRKVQQKILDIFHTSHPMHPFCWWHQRREWSKKNMLFILVMCFFLPHSEKSSNEKAHIPAAVFQRLEICSIFLSSRRFSRDFFKATPWGPFDDHHDPGAVFGLIKLAERSKKFRLKGRSPVE